MSRDQVRYLHSDVDTLERIEIIRDLRLGAFDVLIGINLLREGLDIPEWPLSLFLMLTKEGYLRSRTSLVQTIGRAARNVNAEFCSMQTGSPTVSIMRLAKQAGAVTSRKPITRNTALRRRRSTSRSMISSTVFMSAETASRSMLMARAAIWSARISGRQCRS